MAKTRLGPHGVPLGDGTFEGKTPAEVAAEAAAADVVRFQRTAEAVTLELREIGGVLANRRIHVGDRHLARKGQVKNLFGVQGSTGSRDKLKAILITRERVKEESWGSAQNEAHEEWTLRLYTGWEDRTDSEAFHQGHYDAIREHFRPVKSIAGLYDWSLLGADIQFARIPADGYLMHVSDIRFEATYYPTIPTITQPGHYASRASTREGYADVADLLAGQLKQVETTRVQHERRRVDERRDWKSAIKELFGIPSNDPKKDTTIQAWQVYRGRDKETRELAMVHRGETPWALECAWSWVDSAESYRKFQTHLDDVRDRFRGLQSLGSRVNPSVSLSRPLQVNEIKGQMLGTVMTHLAVCEVLIEEVVHA